MKYQGWLLIFYSVPSKPVNNRMKIWRRLAKAGAVPLKGAVYVLPHDEEHYEFFQWLISEVVAVGGEGDFVRVDHIEGMRDHEIAALFIAQRDEEYRNIEERLGGVERQLGSLKKGSRGLNVKSLSEQIRKIDKEYKDARGIDFFASERGKAAGKRIGALTSEIEMLSGGEKRGSKPATASLTPRAARDYQGKIWVTRKRPFVDRIASAWLVRKCIDPGAAFAFVEEKEMEGLGQDRITFDVRNGEFTHVGDLCTFEVLLKSFGIKDRVLRKVAEVVHELDVRDGKYETPEARGIEEILTGIRKTAKDDSEILYRGMAVFEMLYASKS